MALFMTHTKTAFAPGVSTIMFTCTDPIYIDLAGAAMNSTTIDPVKFDSISVDESIRFESLYRRIMAEIE